MATLAWAAWSADAGSDRGRVVDHEHVSVQPPNRFLNGTLSAYAVVDFNYFARNNMHSYKVFGTVAAFELADRVPARASVLPGAPLTRTPVGHGGWSVRRASFRTRVD